MQKKLLPLLLLPVLALASCGGTSTPTKVGSENKVNPTPSTSKSQDVGDQSMSSEEAQVLKELNAARAVARTCGDTAMPAVSAVTWNGYLAAAARAHALDMATRGFFDHVNPDGKGISARAEAAGYTDWTELGENIAAGQGLSAVTQAWLSSPSHCKTLMDPALKEVGIGYVYRSGSPYGTYWVQDFGTR